MESSDDNFAWTSASSDTSDSDSNNKNMSTTVHTKIEDGDSTDNKKKLQKRLFAEEPGSDGEEPPRKRKKKLKRERAKTPLSPRVKREYESDAETELARLVKEEQVSDYATATATNGTNHDASLPSERDTFTINDRKSKKSKKSKRHSSLNADVKDMIVEDMFSAEETVVEERQSKTSEDSSEKRAKHRKSKSQENGITHTYEENSSNTEISENKKKKKKKKRKTDSESQEVEQIISETDATGGDMQETSFQSVKSSKRKTLLSDRIQFIDDDLPTENHNTTNSHPANIVTQSTRLKRFLKSRPSLKLVTPNSGSNSHITPDDEVWVIKCPHDFDITNLRGKDLNLDTKCKLKVDGQTYEGSLNDKRGTVPISSCANDQNVVNNVSVLGTVTFRRRIPKPHVVEDNVILNNQTNFIPLPDTKIRHPLFGSDYKKAIKIPSAIKERLKCATEPEQVLSEKKKKKKRHRAEECVDVEEPVPDVHKLHKKKKHRHLSVEEDDAPPRKKSKKVKTEVSADTWESEKAIEESLFNF